MSSRKCWSYFEDDFWKANFIKNKLLLEIRAVLTLYNEKIEYQIRVVEMTVRLKVNHWRNIAAGSTKTPIPTPTPVSKNVFDCSDSRSSKSIWRHRFRLRLHNPIRKKLNCPSVKNCSNLSLRQTKTTSPATICDCSNHTTFTACFNFRKVSLIPRMI